MTFELGHHCFATIWPFTFSLFAFLLPHLVWCLCLVVNIYCLLVFHAEFRVEKQLFHFWQSSYQVIIMILRLSIICLDKQWPSFRYFLRLTAVLSSRPINADYLGQHQLLNDWLVWCDFRAVVMTQEWFWPPGDIWQGLETFLFITTKEEVLLASSGWSQGCC